MPRSTAHCQPSTPDSLKTVQIPKWQVWRLIHETQKARFCDSLRNELEKESVAYRDGLRKADTVIGVLEHRLELERAGGAIMRSKAELSEKMAESYRKELRRQKRKTVIVGAFGLVLVVLAVL